jgi:Mitochondrial ribosomal protein (VAR1)
MYSRPKIKKYRNKKKLFNKSKFKYFIKKIRKFWKKKKTSFIQKMKNKSTFRLFMYLKKRNHSRKHTIYLINNKKFKNDTKLKNIKKKIFLYEYYKARLYFNGYLFNVHNLVPLINILKKIYNKNMELNIVNLKYLYLDSNIFAEAITKKLTDRKKRVLRVLKLGLKLTKKPYFKIHFHKDIINIIHKFYDKKLNININSLDKDFIKNKYLLHKPNIYKTRLVLYHMKQKVISGIRLEGSGRLTKRLTASRSISKYKYMGSLKNLDSSYKSLSTVMLRGFAKSNLQYININNHNRNGSFGVKVSVSVY